MKKYFLSLAVLVVAVAAMAFTNVAVPVPAEEEFVTKYQFGGTSMNDVYELDEWAPISGAEPSCVDGSLPCVVEVQSGTLETWLNARDHDQILRDAKTRKP